MPICYTISCQVFELGGIFSLLGKVLVPCLEVIVAVRLCLSMQNASTMAGEESNLVIGWVAKVRDRTETSCGNVPRFYASLECSGFRFLRGSWARTVTSIRKNNFILFLLIPFLPPK